MQMKSISLPLHYGSAPDWLLVRMKGLSLFIMELILDEFGIRTFMDRISDPIFFQSFSNLLGFDWNSSGSTTVLCGVLKSVLNENDMGVRVAGGKGKHAHGVQHDINVFGQELGLKTSVIEEMLYMSRLSSKVDMTALQDGYDLYHHCMFIGEDGTWAVVQQGMNSSIRMARRYHWNFETSGEFNNPHSGIITQRFESNVLNLVAEESENCRKTSLDVVNDGTFRRDYSALLSLLKNGGCTLFGRTVIREYRIPTRINWKAIERAYELQPDKYEDLLMLNGVGKETVRALSLISSFVYSEDFSREDPAKYCFTVGGKDGVPFPVRRDTYDEVIEFMREALRQKKLGDYSRIEALRNLRRY